MRLSSRLDRLEKQQPTTSWVEERWREFSAEMNRKRAELLAVIPPELRETVQARIEADWRDDRELLDWPNSWCAPWAGFPKGWLMPVAFVEWVLHPPRRIWFASTWCTACGLNTPLYRTWSNDPNPPPTVAAFDKCPSCGAPTSYQPPKPETTP